MLEGLTYRGACNRGNDEVKAAREREKARTGDMSQGSAHLRVLSIKMLISLSTHSTRHETTIINTPNPA